MLFQNREVATTPQILVLCKQNLELRNLALRKGTLTYVIAEDEEWTRLRNNSPLDAENSGRTAPGVGKRLGRALRWGCLPTSQVREEGRPS